MQGPFFFKFGLPGAHGVWTHTFKPSDHGVRGVNEKAYVVASACEVGQGGMRFIGDASIQVLNIAPAATGDISIRLNILWDHNLSVECKMVIWTDQG